MHDNGISELYGYEIDYSNFFYKNNILKKSEEDLLSSEEVVTDIFSKIAKGLMTLALVEFSYIDVTTQLPITLNSTSHAILLYKGSTNGTYNIIFNMSVKEGGCGRTSKKKY